jgi:hypothetical protein
VISMDRTVDSDIASSSASIIERVDRKILIFFI